tara:strand:- start:2 stop:316 length:315 start_codon:yes stop_codon:yes gene_type:complete
MVPFSISAKKDGTESFSVSVVRAEDLPLLDALVFLSEERPLREERADGSPCRELFLPLLETRVSDELEECSSNNDMSFLDWEELSRFPFPYFSTIDRSERDKSF